VTLEVKQVVKDAEYITDMMAPELTEEEQVSIEHQGAVPAGISDNGDYFFYPPANIPAQPAGFGEHMEPLFELPPAPLPVPAGYTTEGMPFYSAEESKNAATEIVGYVSACIGLLRL